METHGFLRLCVLAVMLVSVLSAALILLVRVAGAALPNGDIIAYAPLIDAQTRTLRLLDVRTDKGALALTFPDTSSIAVGWSPDGRYYACWSQTTTAVYLLDLQTGTSRRIDDVADQTPRWSPDSRSLLFYNITSAPTRVDIYAVDVASGERRPLTASEAN